MRIARLENMMEGWFVGGFEPTALSTRACEAGIRQYRMGEKDVIQCNRDTTEVLVLLAGTVGMRQRVWQAGDIIIVEPGDMTVIEALTEATAVVVRVPGVFSE